MSESASQPKNAFALWYAGFCSHCGWYRHLGQHVCMTTPPKLCVRCNLPFVVTFVRSPGVIPGYGPLSERCPKCGGDVFEGPDLPEVSFKTTTGGL